MTHQYINPHRAQSSVDWGRRHLVELTSGYIYCRYDAMMDRCSDLTISGWIDSFAVRSECESLMRLYQIQRGTVKVKEAKTKLPSVIKSISAPHSDDKQQVN